MSLAKFKGALVGALLGDCLGESFESAEVPVALDLNAVEAFFQNIKENKYEKGSLDYTDDTSMTKILASSLINHNGVNIDKLAIEFAKDYLKNVQRGYGMHVRSVFIRLIKGHFGHVLEPAQEQFGGSGSYGNGAAMRVTPVALFYNNDTDKMIEAARNSSLVTHAHRNGYNGAILLCLAIKMALEMDPNSTIDPVTFVNELLIKMTEIENDQTKDYCERIVKMKELLTQEQRPTIKEVVSQLGNDVTALEAVPAAVFSFLFAQAPIHEVPAENQFERTVKYAISLGGDTDTIGCMAGAISGAHLGLDAIPSHLIGVCEDNENIISLAEQLFEATSHS